MDTNPRTLSPDFSRGEWQIDFFLERSLTWDRFDVRIDLVPYFENERFLLVEQMLDGQFDRLLVLPDGLARVRQYLRAAQVIGVSRGVGHVRAG